MKLTLRKEVKLWSCNGHCRHHHQLLSRKTCHGLPSTCTSSVQQDWLSYPPPSTIQLLPTLPPTPPQTPQQWVGSTPSRPRYSPYPRQPQLSKPGKIPGVARFASPLSKEELKKKCQRFVPSNTQRNNTWATNVFAEWLSERNKQTIEQYPDILQSQQPTSTVDAAFILEARRKDRDCYPANTLKNILAAIYCIMKASYKRNQFHGKRIERAVIPSPAQCYGPPIPSIAMQWDRRWA